MGEKKKANPYRLFCSPEGDWYVTAVKRDGKIVVLGEGHSRYLALEAILEDLGFEFRAVEKDMPMGTYRPKLKDWKEDR